MKRILSLAVLLGIFLCMAVPAAAMDVTEEATAEQTTAAAEIVAAEEAEPVLLAADTEAVTQAAVRNATSAGLKFKEDGSFKIIQVSDTQEFIISSPIAQEYFYDLAKNEKPDLFILTGDNMSGGGAAWAPKFLAKWLVKISVDNLMKSFDKIYKEFGIPMTMVFGNHDNEAGADKVTRAELFAMYEAHDCFIGYYIDEADGKTKDTEGQHYGTHNLIVHDKTGKTPTVNLWMFDSGSYHIDGGYSQVQTPQIDWFKAENTKTGNLPSLAFQHIVVPEIFDFLTQVPGVKDGLTPEEEKALHVHQRSFRDADGKTFYKTISRDLPAGVKGVLGEEPCPGPVNDGQYAALAETNVMAMFFGHEHINTFEVKRDDGPDLVNSPGSSFGSYGNIDTRGVRIITLSDANLTTYNTKVATFQDYYGPNSLRRARLQMYESELGTFATFFDYITFIPLLWLQKIFG